MISLKGFFFFLSEIQTANSLNDIHWKFTYSDNTEAANVLPSSFILSLFTMLHFMFIFSTKEKKSRCSRSPFWLFVSVSQSSSLHSVFMFAAWCLSLTSGLHIWSARRGQPLLQAAITCQSHSHSTYSSQVN